MTLDARAIKARVSEQLIERLGERWFDLSGSGLRISAEDNQTDFSIRIDVQAEHLNGEYHCDLIVTHKWKRFRDEFREFLKWHQQRVGQPVKIQNHDFLYTPLRRILWSSGVRRQARWINDWHGVETFVQSCVEDFDGAAGAWIRGWFTWPSALKMMEDDEQLGGSWRESAYFMLILQTRGVETACAYLRREQLRKSPQFMESQIEYLLDKHCPG